MGNLRINPKFKEVIPPLSEEEYAALRDSIKVKRNGMRYAGKKKL